jgi:hypothetical protein
MTPKMLYLWDFLISSTVPHPPCRSAQKRFAHPVFATVGNTRYEPLRPETLTVTQLVKQPSPFPHFIEPERSVPCSQEHIKSEAFCNISQHAAFYGVQLPTRPTPPPPPRKPGTIGCIQSLARSQFPSIHICRPSVQHA